MKIMAIDIENHKKIRVFHAKLDGKNLLVAGEVGSGKTTAISALWDVLVKGSDAITHGEEEGTISVVLSDGSKTLICSRRYTKKTSTIHISDSEGGRLTAKDIDLMLSDLSANPHKIAQMKPKERVDTLLKSAGIEDQLNELDEKIGKAEEDRLYFHREKNTIDPGEKPEEKEKIDVKELLDRIDKGRNFNRALSDIEDKNNNLKNTRKELQEEIADLKKRITLKETLQVETEIEMESINEKLAKRKRKDISHLANQLEKAEEINARADVFAGWKRRHSEFKLADNEHRKASEAVKAIQKEKAALLDDIKFPLKGLTIQDGQLYFKDALFENLGTSEQMLVCAALAKEQIGEIRIVRMDGIESMSKKDFDTLKKLFADADIQVLASRVSRGELEPEEIVIEEGEYKDGK